MRHNRGGAVHARPDNKMGHRLTTPLTWFVDARDKPGLRKVLKKSSTRKRRQRDKQQITDE